MGGAPSVEMLWEASDPNRELTKRFGFADPASAARWVADALRATWGLDPVRCHRLVISGRNAMAWLDAGDRRLIAKWSALPARFAQLEDAALLVSWLDAEGLPVASPIPTLDGRLLAEMRNQANSRMRSRLPLPGSRFLLGVFPVIEGQLLEVGEPSQLEDAGRVLATLHEALAAYPHPFQGRRPPVGTQLLHNDIRSANLLHDGTAITAILDFEEVTVGRRTADLAKSAALLATRYRKWGPTTEAQRAAFIAAYDRSATDPLTASERHEIDQRIAGHLEQFGWT